MLLVHAARVPGHQGVKSESAHASRFACFSLILRDVFTSSSISSLGPSWVRLPPPSFPLGEAKSNAGAVTLWCFPRALRSGTVALAQSKEFDMDLSMLTPKPSFGHAVFLGPVQRRARNVLKPLRWWTEFHFGSLYSKRQKHRI